MIKPAILLIIFALCLSAMAEEKIVTVGLDSGNTAPVSTIAVTQPVASSASFTAPAKKSGYGISFAITPGICRLDLSPVIQAVGRDQDLSGKQFDWSQRDLGAVGVWLYGGVNRGIRMGFNGTFGYKSFFSDPFTGLDSLGMPHDSEAVLDLMLAYGGLTVEKAWTAGDFHFLVGGMAGGGAMIILKTMQSVSSPFATAWGGNPDGVAVAPLLAAGLHAGITYSLTSWFHLGLDVRNDLFYAQRGFGFGSKDFATGKNPGGRLRVIFGNLG